MFHIAYSRLLYMYAVVLAPIAMCLLHCSPALPDSQGPSDDALEYEDDPGPDPPDAVVTSPPASRDLDKTEWYGTGPDGSRWAFRFQRAPTEMPDDQEYGVLCYKEPGMFQPNSRAIGADADGFICNGKWVRVGSDLKMSFNGGAATMKAVIDGDSFSADGSSMNGLEFSVKAHRMTEESRAARDAARQAGEKDCEIARKCCEKIDDGAMRLTCQAQSIGGGPQSCASVRERYCK